MDDWQKREVENEAHFRGINEWIEVSNDDFGEHHITDEYVCECGDRSCRDPITLTRDEYELVRSEPTRFAIATNHENPELDRVIIEHDRYTVVEKWFGEAARIAQETNPRTAAGLRHTT
jgi:hypothetical protein